MRTTHTLLRRFFPTLVLLATTLVALTNPPRPCADRSRLAETARPAGCWVGIVQERDHA